MAAGVRWEFRPPAMARMAAALLATLLLAPLTALPADRMEDLAHALSVIVRRQPGTGVAAERAVHALGGRVERPLGIIGGFSATVPAAAVDDLEAHASVLTVTPDYQVHLQQTTADYGTAASGTGSLVAVGNMIGARQLWDTGVTGRGIGVALIDSGVVPVPGMDLPNLVYGPDLSFESQFDEARHLDTFGHGTHLAGIIAGRDRGAVIKSTNNSSFLGIAPEATLLSMKVATANGATDVSQVLAAIDWVVQHGKNPNLNIRVLNLAFGTDGTQDYRYDPLTYAVEAAWRNGIVVVVSAGNSNFGTSQLNNPAYDPFVLAVGASDPWGTRATTDDLVPAWSARGTAARRPDLVAPGRSVVSLRNAGSYLDEIYPGGRVGDRWFRGSGTSQSAAVVSGAAALLLQARPELTPDQVKRALTKGATYLVAADAEGQGAGMVNVPGAVRHPVSGNSAMQVWEPAVGTGTLEGARGSVHVSDGVSWLTGEQDIFGMAWNGARWAPASLGGTAWDAGTWNGSVWTGSTWNGSTWNGSTWNGSTWNGSTWNGSTWNGSTWNGSTWNGSTWNGSTWNGSTWNGSTWNGSTWNAVSWNAVSWGGDG